MLGGAGFLPSTVSLLSFHRNGKLWRTVSFRPNLSDTSHGTSSAELYCSRLLGPITTRIKELNSTQTSHPAASSVQHVLIFPQISPFQLTKLHPFKVKNRFVQSWQPIHAKLTTHFLGYAESPWKYRRDTASKSQRAARHPNHPWRRYPRNWRNDAAPLREVTREGEGWNNQKSRGIVGLPDLGFWKSGSCFTYSLCFLQESRSCKVAS